ncbi:MAG: histidine kinase N-terminal 7TM domain-containing protein [Chloroflexota bacterium]
MIETIALALPASLLTSATISFIAAYIAWQQRRKPSAIPMTALGLCVGLWAVFYFLELISVDLQAKLFWAGLKYPLITTAPVVLSAFVLRFAGWQDWPSKRLLPFLLVVPALTVLVVLTNSHHHLFWQDFELVAYSGYMSLRAGRGPWFWVHAGYSYGLILSTSAAALSTLVQLGQAYRRQILSLVVGLSIPLAGNLLTLSNPRLWPGIDLGPVAFSLGAFFLLISTHLASILDIVPLAHTTLVEQMRDGVLVVDKNGTILELNRAAEHILDLPLVWVIGKNAASLDHPAFAPLKGALTSETIRQEIQLGTVEAPRWYDMRITRILTAGGEFAGRMIIWHDITDRKLVESELRHAATHDPLTGLYNRMYFDEAFNRISRGRRWPVTVIMIDLDNLKITNDTLGHLVGDEVLQQAANLLRKTFRQEDLIARIGGDEFVILVPNCEDELASQLIRRLRGAALDYNSSGPRSQLDFSLGYAVACDPEELVEAMLFADERMYTDKRQRNMGKK